MYLIAQLTGHSKGILEHPVIESIIRTIRCEREIHNNSIYNYHNKNMFFMYAYIQKTDINVYEHHDFT